MNLHIYKDAEEVTDKLAEWIAALIERTLEVKEKFTIALSGGETPKLLYQKLATAPYKEKIQWNRIEFFWGDERLVPFEDERNNAKMAYDNLLEKVNVSSTQIHSIWTNVSPLEAADQYEKLLHTFFDNTQTSFDLVLLGLGEDGHTLSLFPASPILNETQHWVNAVELDDKRMSRVTLMPPIVNNASAVVFLITGMTKEKIVKEVLKGRQDIYPSQLIKPINGELLWFMDEAAAKLLKD